MRLVYKQTGMPVLVGDMARLNDGTEVEITYFRPPHKPASSGKVSVKHASGWTQEFYVGVIGAEWIDREDRKGGTTYAEVDVTARAIARVLETLDDCGNNLEWQQHVIREVQHIVDLRRDKQLRAMEAMLGKTPNSIVCKNRIIDRK